MVMAVAAMGPGREMGAPSRVNPPSAAEVDAAQAARPHPAPNGAATPTYADTLGLCKAATLAEIEAQGWSLNPGRYVGVAAGEEISDEDFKEQLQALNEELQTLNTQARDLEQTIAANVAGILGA